MITGHNKEFLKDLTLEASIQQILLELVNICSQHSFDCSEANMVESADNWKDAQHAIHDAFLKLEDKPCFPKLLGWAEGKK